MGGHRSVNLMVCIPLFLTATLFCYGVGLAEKDSELRLFEVEKSFNPQNILVVYARVQATCEVQPIPDAGSLHLFDLHWLMNGTTFKPTHRLIKKAARKRFVAQSLEKNGLSFTVRLTDLKELHHDLPSDNIHVKIVREPPGNCRSRVLLKLGPRHANRTMAIETIYSEAKTFFSIPIGIHFIELRGTDIHSNEPMVARFNSTNPHQNHDAAGHPQER